MTIFFHLLFKTLALFLSIFGSWFRMFWGGLYVAPLCWSLLLIVGVLRLQFEYLPIVIAALVLSFANILGYIKCSSSAKDKMKSMVEQGMRQGSMAALENSSVRNWVLNSLLAVTAGGNNSNSAGSGAKARGGDSV